MRRQESARQQARRLREVPKEEEGVRQIVLLDGVDVCYKPIAPGHAREAGSLPGARKQEVYIPIDVQQRLHSKEAHEPLHTDIRGRYAVWREFSPYFVGPGHAREAGTLPVAQKQERKYTFGSVSGSTCATGHFTSRQGASRLQAVLLILNVQCFH